MSSDMNAASWDQLCDTLQGSELWANPRAALQGTQTVHKAGEKRRGGGVGAPAKAQPGTHLGRGCAGSAGGDLQ